MKLKNLVNILLTILCVVGLASCDSLLGSKEDSSTTSSSATPLYVVRFDSAGGTAVSSIEVVSGSKVKEPTAPTKAGYAFGGWYKEAACTTAWNFSSDTVTGAITLYAKWVVNGYTVTFDSQGGSSVQGLSANHGSKIGSPSNPTNAGYAFGGWYKEAACTTAWNFSSDTVTGAITLYAKWTAVSYSISYTLNDGTQNAANPSTYTVESAAITLASPTRASYTFDGWYAASDFSGTAVTSIAKGSSGDKTFYAKWTAVSYSISYTLNGGTNAAANPASYTIESAAITLASPTRTSYTFAGWYAASDFSGTAVTSIAKGSSGDKTFYAKWLPIPTVDANLAGLTISGLPADLTLSVSETWTLTAELAGATATTDYLWVDHWGEKDLGYEKTLTVSGSKFWGTGLQWLRVTATMNGVKYQKVVQLTVVRD